MIGLGARYRNTSATALARLLSRYARLERSPFPRSAPSAGRLTIALTTLPSRLPKIASCLLSLLDQEVPALRVLLVLPPASRREGRGYVVPGWLAESDAIEIVRCDRDWGPATKLIPALSQVNGPLVIVDDDNIYPPDLVKTLLEWHDLFPTEALGYRGWVLPASRDWRETEAVYATGLRSSLPVDVVTGTWGVLVDPSFFDAAVRDYRSFPSDAFFVDDIWLNGHLARRGVPRRVVRAERPPLPTATQWRNALGARENADGRRNNVLIRAFAEDW